MLRRVLLGAATPVRSYGAVHGVRLGASPFVSMRACGWHDAYGWTRTPRNPTSHVRTYATGPEPDDTKRKEGVPSTPPPRLTENLLNIPNLLTMSRIGMCPVIGWAVITEQPFLALGLLTVAGTTDLLDGYIARRYNKQSVFGSIADPAADKLLMTTMVVSLTASGQMPLWLAGIIVGRDVYLTGLAFYLRYRSLPAPRTWARYWDPRYPSVQVKPTQLSKYNTFLQLVLVGALTVYPCLPEEWQTHPHVTRTRDALQYLVAATTVWTGLDYAFSRHAVKYLHRK